MTVWIVWLLAIGLIFGLGLVSARVARREQLHAGVKTVKSTPANEGYSPINGFMNDAKAGMSTNVSAFSLASSESRVGTLHGGPQRAAANGD